MKRTFLLLLLGLFGSLAGQAQTYLTEAGRVTFTSAVPLHTFTGESDLLAGLINLADSTVDFYVDLTTLKTGIGKRDKDMRKTLETDDYPFAEFTGRLVSPFDPNSNDAQPVQVQGTFKLHGINREVTVEGTLQQTPEGLQVEAAWELNLKDYEIEPPGLLFYKVDETQDVRISALLTRRNE